MTRLFVGVDGGASGCRARIADEAGRMLGQGGAGPANPRFGAEAAQAQILAAIRAALAAAGLPDDTMRQLHAGLGLAGAGQERERTAMLRWSHPFPSLALDTDAYAGCLGAHGGADGGTIVLGTGSCGVAIVGGQLWQIGGWGFPISDQASGAWLGLEAIRHALMADGGAFPATALDGAVLARFDGQPVRAVDWMGEATSRHYAEFAPLVIDAAAAGDATAVALMRQAAADCTLMIAALERRGAPAVALLGGLAPILQPWLAPEIAARLATPRGDNLDGALIMARRGAG